MPYKPSTEDKRGAKTFLEEKNLGLMADSIVSTLENVLSASEHAVGKPPQQLKTFIEAQNKSLDKQALRFGVEVKKQASTVAPLLDQALVEGLDQGNLIIQLLYINGGMHYRAVVPLEIDSYWTWDRGKQYEITAETLVKGSADELGAWDVDASTVSIATDGPNAAFSLLQQPLMQSCFQSFLQRLGHYTG